MQTLHRPIPPPCPICKEHLYLSRCPCATGLYYFSRMASFGYYYGELKKIINILKYQNRKELAYPLGVLLAMYFKDKLIWNDIECVVPIPLYKDVLKKRGFNQSLFLAEEFKKEAKVSLMPKFLEKMRSTQDQTTLGALKRQKNVEGVFNASKECKGKNILLIDDVFTTGATVNEASKVLLEKGAKKVSVLTLAQTPLKEVERFGDK